MKSSMELLRKLKVPYDPAITFLGMYPKKLKSGYNKDTYTQVHCRVIHNRQDTEIPRCLKIDKWIKNIYIYIYIIFVCKYTGTLFSHKEE
jgi:hypothetical protein